jgi:uncharacterized RDD family membrane protein YckC
MDEELRYVGFWMRFLATMIDSVILSVLMVVLLVGGYGVSNLARAQADMEGWLGTAIQLGLAVVIIVLWQYWGGTPGKRLLRQRIVDAKTGQAPSTGQLIGRFFAYIVSTLPFCLGFLWVAFDKRKQGWHDKLSGTLVVYDEKKKAS